MMMSLGDVVVWLVLIGVAAQFWRIRSISEQASRQIRQYCDTHQLQLLSVARQRTRLTWRTGKPDWLSVFVFEFSGNGEDRYVGQAEFVGKRLLRTQLPPYRV